MASSEDGGREAGKSVGKEGGRSAVIWGGIRCRRGKIYRFVKVHTKKEKHKAQESEGRIFLQIFKFLRERALRRW